MRIDWGDGSPATILSNADTCVDPYFTWPDKTWQVSTHHQYARRGTYQVRAKVTSTGCFGEEPRQTSVGRSNITVRN